MPETMTLSAPDTDATPRNFVTRAQRAALHTLADRAEQLAQALRWAAESTRPVDDVFASEARAQGLDHEDDAFEDDTAIEATAERDQVVLAWQLACHSMSNSADGLLIPWHPYDESGCLPDSEGNRTRKAMEEWIEAHLDA